LIEQPAIQMLSNLFRNTSATYSHTTTQSKHSKKFNLLQHNRQNQRKRTQRRSSTTRPSNPHTSDNEHSEPEHNFYAVENDVRFRAGPFAEAGAVFG
jgi:hypothetical protein